jgi:single-strand DNA-binding protein
VDETPITVVGNVVDVPRRNRLATGSVTNFRMASTARRFDEQARGFIDSSTLWIDVACWGELGGNVARSVSKGDPVVVVGTIATDSWDTEAGRRSATRIRASSVGLNLARGHAVHKQPRTQADAPASPEPPGEGPPADVAGPARPADPPRRSLRRPGGPAHGLRGGGRGDPHGRRRTHPRGRPRTDADVSLPGWEDRR